MQAAVTKSLDSFKSQAAAAGSTAPQAVLLFKGQLEQHAQHVLAAVKHRAAALGFEAQHAAATPSTAPAAAGTSTAPHDAWWHQQGSASQHTVMLQQAHEQCAERVEGDRKLLGEAAQRAVQLMQLEVAKLQAKGWPNAFLSGRLVEVSLHLSGTFSLSTGVQTHAWTQAPCEEVQLSEAGVTDEGLHPKRQQCY
jgi:hypothetical protein